MSIDNGSKGFRMTNLTRSGSKSSEPAKHSGETEINSVAVAIKHRPTGPASLPKIIASGRGKVGEKILEIAYAEGVKVREDADLAELLVAADIDSEIPVEAFIAVAEILRYVYIANDAEGRKVG